MKDFGTLNTYQWNLPLYIKTYTTRTVKIVLFIEVSLIQRLSNIVKYYCGTRTSVLDKEMSSIQGVLYRKVPMCAQLKIFLVFMKEVCSQAHASFPLSSVGKESRMQRRQYNKRQLINPDMTSDEEILGEVIHINIDQRS